MLDFMMPPAGGMPNELPPGLPPPAIPQAVPLPMPVQEVPLQAPAPMAPAPVAPQIPAEAVQGVLQEEGATGPSATGTGFFDKLRTDPKMSQAMLMMGMRMMQGNRPGQDSMGMVGDAMMAAATAHNMLSYNEKNTAIKERELGMREKESSTRVAQTEQEMAQKAELFPDAKAKIAQEVRNLRTQGKGAEADLLIKDAKAGNIKTELDLQNRTAQAEITQRNSASNSSNASAESARALTADRRLTTALRNELLDPKTTPERVAQIQRMHQADDPTARSVTAKQDAELKLVKLANPDFTDAQAAQEVLSMNQTSKANYMAAAQKIVENSEGTYTAQQVSDARSYITSQVTNQANRGKGGVPPPAGVAAPVADHGLKEEDITFTMQKRGMTREQVIAKYGKGAK